jgi:DNA-binding transcriptional regulator YiaG
MRDRPTVAYVQKTCPHCGSKIELVSGASLRAVRQRAEISLRTAALRFGCSAAYLCDIEHGNRRCPDRLLRLYEALARRSS